MAGTQDASENPVAINVVPMVDVIFCLCVFFMCSMQWKDGEGQFDTWLPKDVGSSGISPLVPEIRVAIFWDAANRRAERVMGHRRIEDDAELQSLLADAHADCVRTGRPQTPCVVDAAEAVPWKQVVDVINCAKRAEIDKIEFAAGRDYEALPSRK